MSQPADISNRDIWLGALIAITIAASLTVLILKAWEHWLGFLAAGYVLLLYGGYLYLPWKGRIGYPIAVGILFGAVIPLGVRIWMTGH